MLLHFFVFLFISCSFSSSEPLNCPQECSEKNELPICASNGKTYKSLCEMHKDNCGKKVTQTDWSKCLGNYDLCPSTCLKIQDPVCGDDGKIYSNKCIMQKNNCGKPIFEMPLKYCVTRNRQSRKFDPCPKECDEFYKPVCATDGNVYFNQCFMRQRNCGKTNVQIAKMNDCVEIPICPERCIAIYDPVCGSNGKLYLNHCKMFEENCGKKISLKPIQYCLGE